MRLLARLLAVAGLVVAGGLTLPGGAAQAAACSGSTGVTVVIDRGSTSSTLCAPGDPSSAMAALQAVASVTQVQTQPGFICQINSYPSSSCVRTPPASAYWAFFHAPRGGSWTYSSSGAGGYDPPAGSVIGFAFGSGGAPSSPPPGATTAPKPAPKPTPRPSPSSSSSKPPATKPKPAGTTPAKPSGSSSSSTTPRAGGAVSGSSASATPGAKPSATTILPNDSTSTTPTGSATVSPNGSTGSGGTTAAAADGPDSGTPVTLLAGLGLVGLVGAGAAYLAMRRRTTT